MGWIKKFVGVQEETAAMQLLSGPIKFKLAMIQNDQKAFYSF